MCLTEPRVHVHVHLKRIVALVQLWQHYRRVADRHAGRHSQHEH